MSQSIYVAAVVVANAIINTLNKMALLTSFKISISFSLDIYPISANPKSLGNFCLKIKEKFRAQKVVQSFYSS